MANALVKQMRRYAKQKHCLHNTLVRYRVSELNGVRVNAVASEQEALQASLQAKGPGGANGDEMPLVEQVKYHKEYTNLLKEGKDVFSSSVEYQNWKEQVDESYANYAPLDKFTYSLDMFSALQRTEKSAIHEQEVNGLTKDKDNFGEFAEIAEKTGDSFIDPSFTSTNEFNAALENTTTKAEDITIISEKQPEVNRNVEMPTNDRSVIDLTNGVIGNLEAMYDDDGLRDKSQLTTLEQQQSKEKVFNALIENSSSQEEVDSVVEAFSISVPSRSDAESNFTTDNEIGSAYAVAQDDEQTFDRVSTMVTDELSSSLSVDLDSSASDTQAVEDTTSALEELFKQMDILEQ